MGLLLAKTSLLVLIFLELPRHYLEKKVQGIPALGIHDEDKHNIWVHSREGPHSTI